MGPVPMSCTCLTCLEYGVCGDTLLLVSLFDTEVHVQKGYIRAIVSDKKKYRSIGGAAGRRKMHIIEERKDLK